MKETQNDAFDKAIDLLIDKAAEKANEEIGNELKDVGDEVEFSKEHQAKMRKFFAKRRRSKALKKFSKYALRAACIVVTMGIISGVAIFSVEAWRVRFLNFVFEVGEKNTDYSFKENSGDNYSDDDVIMDYLPTGFIITEKSSSRFRYFAQFVNGDLYFQVIITGPNGSSSIDTENGVFESVVINNYDGVYVSTPDLNSLIWHDNEKVYCITGNISREELIKIGEKIKIAKSTKLK